MGILPETDNHEKDGLDFLNVYICIIDLDTSIMHYRPLPRGYNPCPDFSTKVKISTITKNINSGNYIVIVFYTDKTMAFDAPIIKIVDGEKAIPLALRMLNKWANKDGKVQKLFRSHGKSMLCNDLKGYKNLYGRLGKSQYEFIALLRK